MRKPSPKHVMIKLLQTSDKEKILLAVRGEKRKVTHSSSKKNEGNLLIRNNVNNKTVEQQFKSAKGKKNS